MHDFSLCLRTGSNPTDINRFRSYAEIQNNKLVFEYTDFVGKIFEFKLCLSYFKERTVEN